MNSGESGYETKAGNHPEELLQEDLSHILRLCGVPFQALKDQRIFISGATGFFGFWLLESFCFANRTLKLNSRATILTRNPDRFVQKWPHLARDAGVHLIRGDIRDFSFPEGTYRFGIHAAGSVENPGSAEAPLEIFSTLVDGTRRYLDFAVAAKMKNVLFISSGAVYGTQPPELLRIPEDYNGSPDPSLPISAYGMGKLAAEHLCSLYGKQYGIETKIARCFAFVGPGMPLNGRFAIGNFIANSVRNEDILVTGDGTPVRSYLYAADLAAWLWTILVKGESARPYNVGSEHPYSILEVAKAVSRCTKSGGNILVKSSAVSDAPSQRYVPNINRCKQELALREAYSLEQAIAKTMLFVRIQETE